MILIFIILCFLILLCVIYWCKKTSIKENLVITPDVAINSIELINTEANYVDSIYLNNYDDKIKTLMTKISEMRSSVSEKNINNFIKFKCSYKKPVEKQLIGVKNDSDYFDVTNTSDGILSNTIHMEVPVGQKGVPGPQGDQGTHGIKGEQGAIGETGNCGSVLN